MTFFLALFYVISAPNQPMSVVACGADPTGKLDSTPAFELCLKQQSAGDILVPYGQFRIIRPIFKNRNQNLIGIGSKASILKCEGLNLPCIVAADNGGGPNNYSVSAIQNLGIEGPGANNHSIGILVGGDPEGKVIAKTAFGDSVNFTDLRVRGFQHGIQWGNNAWANKIFHCSIFENGSGLFAPVGLQNSGEAIGITDSDIFNNGHYGLEDHANFEWMVQGTSFDYNTTAVAFLGSTFHAANCHFEQDSALIFFQPYGDATLSIKDSEIQVQASGGNEKYILSLWPQSLIISIDDVSIWSNHPVQYFMRVQGHVAGTISNLHKNGNKKIGAMFDAPNAVALTAITAF